MARLTAENVESIPYGPLGIIAMPGCEELADKIDSYLVKWRKGQALEHQGSIAFYGYQRDSFLIDISNPRFGSGEGKAVINDSVRGYDLYIVTDCFNYSVKYKMYGMEVPKSPDDHFADLKELFLLLHQKQKEFPLLCRCFMKAVNTSVQAVNPFDCAMALQELVHLGVENIITFDAHDQRVQNSIPHKSFENVMPTYQMIKALINSTPDLKVNKDSLMVISPDEGAMQRCIFFATQLGINLGMFYKRRDYTRVVNGRNPIVEHQYLGDSVEGKDIIVVDDMISSGESMLEVAKKLKQLGANRIFVCTTFGLFSSGLEVFDKAYEEGTIEKVFTTNGVYRTPELLAREWYESVELSKYIAYFLDTLNHDMSVSTILDSSAKIDKILKEKGLKA